ncbi:MAG TPA: hypothetical protein VGL20_07865 [Candidatus Dormibacteraeota bacterium]
MTRMRVLVVLVVAVVAAVALFGPGHLATIAILIGLAFLALVAVGVVHGLRDGLAGDRDEAGPEPPSGPGTTNAGS